MQERIAENPETHLRRQLLLGQAAVVFKGEDDRVGRGDKGTVGDDLEDLDVKGVQSGNFTTDIASPAAAADRMLDHAVAQRTHEHKQRRLCDYAVHAYTHLLQRNPADQRVAVRDNGPPVAAVPHVNLQAAYAVEQAVAVHLHAGRACRGNARLVKDSEIGATQGQG